jgi:alkanesulfonate monooxygenase SsuD/methylene tetrahydromethanopterin reductase-like flavin-dependent oxidoreductase (luciferase family)
MSRIRAILRLNLSGRSPSGESDADRYAAALDLAAMADDGGFDIVNVEEHHDAEAGWMSSPLVMAGLVLGRTRRVTVRACAIIGPLYDPIRLAEEVATLDAASRGRFTFVLGQGYRPSEYHALDRDWSTRGAATEHLMETLLAAWKGEPFEYRGRTIHVSPRPFSKPHPPFFYGAMSPVGVKRAARCGLPFFPAQPSPELEALYRAEIARHGGVAHVEDSPDGSMLFIDHDPEAAWRELGPCFLQEAGQYSTWTTGGIARPYESLADSVAALRATGAYEILTPDECLARARSVSRDYRPILHPLAGGVPIERARRCVQLFVDEVLRRC